VYPPEAFIPYLVDNVRLCGASCVWHVKGRHRILYGGDGEERRGEETGGQDLVKWKVELCYRGILAS